MRSLFRLTSLLALAILGSAPLAVSAPFTGGTGPGGFVQANGSSSLQLWLRGDAGITTSGGLVTTWNDQSGYGRNFSQGTVANQPTTNVQNGNAVVDFAAAQNFVTRAGFTSGFTSAQLIIASRGDFDGGGPQFGAPHNVGNVSNNHFPWTDGVIYDTFGTNNRHTTGNPTQPLNQWNIYNVLASTPTWTSRINGTQHFTTNANNTAGGFNTTASANMEVGRQQAAYIWTGEIGDFVLYNATLSSAQTTVTENHYSAKYNIGINVAVDHYSGDTGIDYDRAVFGVGDDGTSEVNNAGMEGFGIEVTDSSLDSNEWVFAGHNLATNSIVAVEDNNNPDSGGQRWNRVWYVDKTATDGVNATLGFDFEDSGLASPLPGSSYHLLYSADNNFTDGWQILDETFSQTNGTVNFNVLNANLLNGYYTLGLNIGVVPEPNSMLIMLGVLGCGMLKRRKVRAESQLG
jgi:hypothetical protein